VSVLDGRAISVPRIQEGGILSGQTIILEGT
jgi:hypothetical protein